MKCTASRGILVTLVVIKLGLQFLYTQDRGRKNYDTLESLKYERRRCKPGTDRPGDLSGKRTGRISFLLRIYLNSFGQISGVAASILRSDFLLFLIKQRERLNKMESLTNVLVAIDDVVWGPWMCVFIMLVGIVLTVSLGVIQFRKLPLAM